MCNFWDDVAAGIWTGSGGNDAQTHVHSGCGVSKCANRDEIYASFGVGANIFEVDSAGCLQRDAAVRLRTPLYGLAHIVRAHVIEQDRFCAEFESLLQFRKAANLDLDGLCAATVAVGAFEDIL